MVTKQAHAVKRLQQERLDEEMIKQEKIHEEKVKRSGFLFIN